MSNVIYHLKTETCADRQAADDLCSDVRASSLPHCPAPVWVKPAYFDAAVARVNEQIERMRAGRKAVG